MTGLQLRQIGPALSHLCRIDLATGNSDQSGGSPAPDAFHRNNGGIFEADTMVTIRQGQDVVQQVSELTDGLAWADLDNEYVCEDRIRDPASSAASTMPRA